MILRLPILMLALWLPAAKAMESVEHKRLGDLSYHIALTTYCSSKNAPDPAVCAGFQPSHSGPTLFFDPLKDIVKGVDIKRPDNLTYGDVAACVDYFISPEKLIAGREFHLIESAAPRKTDSSDPSSAAPETSNVAPVLYPTKRSELQLQVTVRCDPRLSNMENARAGHVNHTHFQAEMLVAQRNNHSLALFQRAVDENPFGALALNAVSDHYLHDSFAPGHIAVWRSKLSDVVANSYHDHQNRKGMHALVRLERLRNEASIGGVSVLDQILSLLATSAPAQHFFMTAEQEAACLKQCLFMTGKDGKSRLDALKAFIFRGTEATVLLKGDDQLWEPDQDTQRFVMLLTAIRSIHDVLETRPNKPLLPMAFKDSFKSNKWAWREEGELQEVPKTPWNGVKLPPSVIAADIGAVEYKVNRRYELASDKDKPFLNRIDNRHIDPIFGVNFGADNMTFGDFRNRWLLGVEGLLIGLTIADGLLGQVSEFGNLAIVGGAQSFVGNGPAGGALSLRAMIVQPQTETAFSLQLRALRIKSTLGNSEWHPALGGRLDMGFTSFITMYVQGGRDWASQSDGSIRSGWSIGAGMQIGSAKCRIRGIRALLGCNN